MRIAFDVGGVLSKYPEVFRELLRALRHADGVGMIELHVITDMHPQEKILDMLQRNDLAFAFLRPDRVHSADYQTHGEECKAVLCRELGIDLLIDDFPGYVATPGSPLVRLLVMPDPTLPYYADSWQTDGSEGTFGRLVRPTKGDQQWS